MSNYDFGIYFGGYSMVIAYSKDDRADVIVNEAGDRTTPSALAVLNNDYSIGLPVKQNLIRNSANSILNTKHFIGKSLNDSSLKEIIKKVPCLKEMDKNEQVVFKVTKNEKEVAITLKQAIEIELKYLLDLAKTSLGLKDTLNCVLSVPCYFTIEQKKFLE
jgi:heat shock 70kDa protein 1/2/6/8